MILVVFFLSLILLIYLLKKSKLNERFSNINNFNNFNNDWFNNNIDLFYINLDISHERRKKMEKQLNKININYNRFNAYNGNLIDKKFNNKLTQDFNTINYNSRIYKNKKGSLGNYISQLTCWYNFYLNSNKKYLMIMEDDILINNNFNTENIYKIINSVKDIDWTMIKFFYFGKLEGTHFNSHLVKANCKNHMERHNTGMQCYILNKEKIPELIKDMLPINNYTFDVKVKLIMKKHNIYIVKEKKKYLSTPEHNTVSDRKKIDNQ